MKELLWMICAICCLSVVIQAADDTTDDGSINVERDEETAEDGDDPFRIKRQHGHGHYNPLSSILSSVFNKKLGFIGSLSSISSSSKAAPETHHHTYDYPSHPPPKPFDWWSFKKTILASLLQAVKAITGGVIALNGQLVKVKGHLLTAKGHLLATKGDSITNFGKHLATHAFSHHEPAHSDIHEASLPAPSVPSSGSATGYGLTGPSSIHGSLDTGYPNNDFKSAIEYPSGYYKDPGSYAKRSIPPFVYIDSNRSNKSRK